MATIIESKGGDFTPHPEGQFIGILRDAYLETKVNKWKGQKFDDGTTDNRDTITEIVLEFLTDHLVDVGGKMFPGFCRFNATASVADTSNLRKFLKGWFPALKAEDFKRFDADKLIGKGAYLTIAHNVSKTNGKTYANVIGAMQPPKGSELPTIPADFVRHQDREEVAPATPEPVQPVSAGDEDDDLPF